MEKHIRIYFNYMGYSKGEFVPCETTGTRYHDIHHIDARGMGGTNIPDVIENLMALTRKAHEFFGDNKEYNGWLSDIHLKFIDDRIPLYQYRPDDKYLRRFIYTFPQMRFL